VSSPNATAVTQSTLGQTAICAVSPFFTVSLDAMVMPPGTGKKCRLRPEFTPLLE
jgi:hypothetical protein